MEDSPGDKPAGARNDAERDEGIESALRFGDEHWGCIFIGCCFPAEGDRTPPQEGALGNRPAPPSGYLSGKGQGGVVNEEAAPI